ncbi:MAG: PadR family transcriptional regulator [Actinomycetota bacterium]|nr:PadR family transcriptional regulator [Actinomycetota bacterium]MDP9020590.1 PadR family transcriptional regulator [Actinomycetota bacterium]
MSAPVTPTTAHGSEPEEVRSRSLLRPAILLLLREQESHGYELMGRLAELGVEVPPTTGGLYRSLRTMAEEGLVSSYWSTPERGPARRVYAITELGEQQLEGSMPALASLLRTVRGMLNRYRSGT